MYYIGIDIGGTGVKVGIVDEAGNITAKGYVETDVKNGYRAIVKDMAGLADKLLKENSISLDEVVSVGMGCPGCIDDKKGVVIYNNNLGFRNVPLCDELKKYFDKPIYVNNDANCAALGEFFALNDDSVENFIAVTLGTGVGSGVIVNKKLCTGFNGIAGELGHTAIVVDGVECSCGRKGCWEAYASVTALIRETEKKAKEHPESLVAKLIEEDGKACGKTAWDAKDAGDKVGCELIDEYIKYVSEGIINLINIFQPSVVAIGGAVSKQGDNLLDPIKKRVIGHTYGGDLVESPKIEVAKLGNDAGIIGAAFLGR